MIRTTVRVATAALGSLVPLGALAAPAAAAGVVPDGCAGSVVYACTGTAYPYEWSGYVREVEVTLAFPGVQVLPGIPVGGQPVGGVLIPVGGQSTPGLDWEVGSTDPMPTGVVTPVNVCLFVRCIAAGTPVVVPGLPLPVVPVSIPAQTLPNETVSVPVLTTVPSGTTPRVEVPPVQQEVANVRVYVEPVDVYRAARTTCMAGGGEPRGSYDPNGAYVWRCEGGTTAPVASALFLAYSAMNG